MEVRTEGEALQHGGGVDVVRVTLWFARGKTAVLDPRRLSRPPLEDALPVRRFPGYAEQRRHPGRYWCETTQEHVGYESRLECAALTLLDFDPRITWIVEQPLRVHFRVAGRKRLHVPDFAVRLDYGSWRIIDVGL